MRASRSRPTRLDYSEPMYLNTFCANLSIADLQDIVDRNEGDKLSFDCLMAVDDMFNSTEAYFHLCQGHAMFAVSLFNNLREHDKKRLAGSRRENEALMRLLHSSPLRCHELDLRVFDSMAQVSVFSRPGSLKSFITPDCLMQMTENTMKRQALICPTLFSADQRQAFFDISTPSNVSEKISLACFQAMPPRTQAELLLTVPFVKKHPMFMTNMTRATLEQVFQDMSPDKLSLLDVWTNYTINSRTVIGGRVQGLAAIPTAEDLMRLSNADTLPYFETIVAHHCIRNASHIEHLVKPSSLKNMENKINTTSKTNKTNETNKTKKIVSKNMTRIDKRATTAQLSNVTHHAQHQPIIVNATLSTHNTSNHSEPTTLTAHPTNATTSNTSMTESLGQFFDKVKNSTRALFSASGSSEGRNGAKRVRYVTETGMPGPLQTEQSKADDVGSRPWLVTWMLLGCPLFLL